jgi:hypothetical protein
VPTTQATEGVNGSLLAELGALRIRPYNGGFWLSLFIVEEAAMGTVPESPKSFISYSWTNEEHKGWVVNLAERLVGDGVDVILDRWHFKEGHDKHAFMEQMVTDPKVNKVLVVCDEKYAAKADGRQGGVGTETQIISKDVYDKVNQEKFIPLIRERDGDGNEFCPVFLRNRKYIDFSNDDSFEESYEALLRAIYDRPELKRPPLGRPPAHLFAEEATQVKTAGYLARLKDAVKRERPHVQAVLQEYLDLFAESLEDFRLTYNPKSDPPCDEQVVQSINAFTGYRDNFTDFVLFATAYMNNTETYDHIFAFLERIAPYRDRPEKVGSWSEVSFDNYRFFLYEMFLYLIAALIKSKRHAAASRFIDGEYHFPENLGGSRYVREGAGAFNLPVLSLEEMRNQRLGLRRYSVVADLIVERATHPKVAVTDILQADFLLFFRPYLDPTTRRADWYPRCIGYAGRAQTFELFARALSKPGMDALRHLLKVKDLQDLYTKINEAFKNQQLRQVAQSERFMHASLEDLMNLHAFHHHLTKND